MACVDVFMLELQLVVQSHPEWVDAPVCLVSNDAANGVVLAVNSSAERSGVKVGDSYVSAISLCPALMASATSEERVVEGTDKICQLLSCYSPSVEASSEYEGIFWLDSAGLGRIFDSEASYVDAICKKMSEAQFYFNVCLGYSKFGTMAMARARRGITIFRTPRRERQQVGQVWLEHLISEYQSLRVLRDLGIVRVEDLLRLPSDGVRCRFSESVWKLYQMARGEQAFSLVPSSIREPITAQCDLDFPDDNVGRLLFVIKGLIDGLLKGLASRYQAAERLSFTFLMEDRNSLSTEISPATPGLDAGVILDLLRLRLDTLRFSDRVKELKVTVQAVPATEEQLTLFSLTDKRDVAAANRAIARLKAIFGADCVVRAQVSEGHLPEASYLFEPLDAVSFPVMKEITCACLQRRIYRKAVPLNTKPVRGPAGIHFGGMGKEAVKEMCGPYAVSGGWWVKEVCRDYYYGRTESGNVLWVYFDRNRRKWFLQGIVE